MTTHAPAIPLPATSALWTAREAAEATGGRSGADWRATGVSIDSRTLAGGDLFIALPGPSHDGHDFVAVALARGAAAAVVARVPEGVAPERLLVVEDTGAALQALARRARARSSPAQVVAVTGSVGKTGTKEMLKQALACQGPTHATDGNLNNHWGVPLTLARMPAASAFAVLEMGMNHGGELTALSRLARPDVAVITAIEPAHLEFFDSVEAIAEAKAEIFSGMDKNGVAILNRDSPYFDRLARHALAAGMSHIDGFGQHIDAEFRLLECAIVDNGTVVEASVLEQPMAYMVGAWGRHWAMNSLAALAAVVAVGARLGPAVDALAAVSPAAGRGNRERLDGIRGGGSIEIIDESYNASPAALAAALTVLGAVRPGPGGRRIAVLGDMLELGEAAAALHAGLAGLVFDHKVDLVFTAGSLMAHLYDALPPQWRGGHATSAALLAAQVTATVRAGDVVLVKGSAGSRTGVVVKALRQIAAGVCGDGISANG
ncbi:MAG: UDP-N-acetylmuramoyl-tripeptide--D-alanyl-D-alanine ligase [Rhodospirillaceae bacterium]|nr:MAG: UDP-N-acetylmuramoyl-tripeptide--D-alanyl-D-alanine ligase [Rhodospirillaceae bacterium]